jgi:hypothetical protein
VKGSRISDPQPQKQPPPPLPPLPPLLPPHTFTRPWHSTLSLTASCPTALSFLGIIRKVVRDPLRATWGWVSLNPGAARGTYLVSNAGTASYRPARVLGHRFPTSACRAAMLTISPRHHSVLRRFAGPRPESRQRHPPETRQWHNPEPSTIR